MPLFCAIDWASQTHYSVLQDPNGLVLYKGSFAHSNEGINTWLKTVQEKSKGQPVALIFEATKHGLFDVLLDCEWLELIPIHPLKTKMLQQLDGESRGKSDPRDTQLLCDYLRSKYHQLRGHYLEHNLTYRLLHERIDQEASLIRQSTRSKNRLHALLRRICPEWDAFVADIDHLVYRQLLLRYAPWDHPPVAQLTRFLSSHNVRGKHAIEQVVLRVRTAQPLSGDPRFQQLLLDQVRSEVRLLDATLAELSKVSDAIHADFCSLPQAQIYLSLPGVGKKLGPRLADFFGSSPQERFGCKEQALCFAGQSPVTKQSGTSRSVHKRNSCNRQARYLCFLWARSCGHLDETTWIRAYLGALKQRGDRIPSRYRKLGSKLLAILYRCLCSNRTYDETLFLKNRFLPHPVA